MLDPTTGAPQLSPTTIKVKGMTYSMKFSVLAQYYADSWGVDVREFCRLLRESNVGILSNVLKMFSAMVAHNFTALKQPVPSADVWAGVIDDIDDEGDRNALITEISSKVGEVLVKKMAASAARLREPASIAGSEVKLN